MITNKDIYNAYPHPDKAMELTLKGRQIKDIIEYTYSYIQFEQNQLSMTIVDETLCTLWQGFRYEVDMTALPFHRVTLKDIELDKTYRVTMTDYTYRNYKHLLEDAKVHHSSFEHSMSTLITEKLKDPVYKLNVIDNFQVKS